MGLKALKHAACKLDVMSKWGTACSKRFWRQRQRTKKHTGNGYASHTQMTIIQSNGALKLDASIALKERCSLQIRKYIAFAVFHFAFLAKQLHTRHVIVPFQNCGLTRVKLRVKM